MANGKKGRPSAAKRAQAAQTKAKRSANRAQAAQTKARRQSNQAAAAASAASSGGSSGGSSGSGSSTTTQNRSSDQSSEQSRQHDAAMQQQGHMNAVELQMMMAAENAKQREFDKKMAAKERAAGYVSNNMRKGQSYDQDFTGGSIDKYAGKFSSNGNSYKGKGFQEFDFRTESRADRRRRRD